MLRSQNYNSEVIISSDGIATSGLPAAGVVVTNANLTAGAICVVDNGNRRLDDTAFAALVAGDKFKIAQSLGTAKPLHFSASMTIGSYTTTVRAHRAALEQITRIGYDGVSTGSLPSANETGYSIRIRKNDNDAANRSQPGPSITAQYTTSTAATQSELAFGLGASLVANLKLEPANEYMAVTVLIDTAATNTDLASLTADTGAITFTKGSTIISAATDIDGGGDIVAGSYIRVTGAATETLLDPVYRVLSVDSANDRATLDMPFAGTTATVASASLHHIAAATGLADNFGIMLTGVAADFDVAAFRDFYKNRFTATFSNKTTLVTAVQGATEGAGAWQRVQMDEYYAQWGLAGQDQMHGTPPRAREQEATSDVQYSSCIFNYTEDVTNMMTSSKFKGSVLVYLELASAVLTDDDTGMEAMVATGVVAAKTSTIFDTV